MGGTTPTSAFAQTGLTGSGGLGGAGTSFYGGSAFGAQGAPSAGGGQFDWTNAFSGTPATPAAPTAATPVGPIASNPNDSVSTVRESSDPNSVNYNTFLPAPVAPTPAPAPTPTPAAPQGGPLNPTPDYLRSLGWVPVGPFGIWQSPDGMSTMNLGTGDPTFPNAAAQYGGMGSMGARR